MSLLRARVNNRDIDIISFEAKYEINSITEFSFETLQRDIYGTDVFLQPVSVFYNGSPLIEGLIYAEPEADFGTDQLIVAKIFAYSQIGFLWRDYSAISDGHYQHQLLTDILFDQLNANTSDWRIGDISTLSDPTIRTTVDLRKKETRWAQVVETVRSVPRTSVRYGTFNTAGGFYTLDVGSFGQLHREPALQGSNIISLKKNKSSRQQLRRIEAFGGRSGDTVINLGNALDFDPSLATHPEYPIVTVGPYYFVEDLSVNVGCVRRMDFDKHRTDNTDTPTTAEIGQAGFALWQDCVREFEKQRQSEEYTIECTMERGVPLVGDALYVKGNAVETIYNKLTKREDVISTIGVDGIFFITSVTLNINDGLLNYTIDVTQNQYDDSADADIDVYERLENTEKFDTARAIIGASIRVGTLTHGPTIASDCTYVGPPSLDGKTFSVPLPTPPSGTTGVTYAVSLSPPDAFIEPSSIIEPALPGTGWSGCVTVPGGWNLATQVTATVTFIFT